MNWKSTHLPLLLALTTACGSTTGPAPQCEPTTCAQENASCGTISDGCGGTVDCGSCSSGATCSSENICVPAGCELATCESANAECGTIADGCGGVLDCGTCTSGQSCGGGGAPNVCSGSTCTPSTCEALGAECGRVADGCGGVLKCGTCAGADVCGGGGQPNVCGSEACVPRTCVDAGAACGVVSDGCADTLECGGCPTGEECSGNQCTCAPVTCEQVGADCGAVDNGCGGTLECGTCPAGQRCGNLSANVCSDVTGQVQWGETFSSMVWGVALTPAGEVIALTSGEDGLSNEVIKFTSGGDLLWRHALPPSGTASVTAHANRPLAAAPHGIYVLHDEAGAGAVLVKLREDGSRAWSRTLGGYVVGLGANDAGTIVAATRDTFNSGGQVYRFDSAGSQAWVVETPGVHAVAVDPSGNVIVGGRLPSSAEQTGVLAGAGAEYEPWLLKLDSAGTVLWQKVLPGGKGDFDSIDTSALGTIVARLALSDGTVTWAGQSFSHTNRPHDERRSVIVAAEPGGAERWAIERRWASVAELAVVPRGEVALMHGVYICTAHLVKYNLAGSELWAGTASEMSCEIGAEVSGFAVAADGQRTVIGGSFRGTHDFGAGPVTASGEDGFLRVFGP